MNHCHEPEPGIAQSSCCDTPKGKPDYLLIVSGTIVLICYTIGLFSDYWPVMPQWLQVMSGGIYELVDKMWWGLLAAVVFVGLLERVPREVVTSALGEGRSFRGILRATFAGLLLDLCSHGILIVGTKLYERGASLGQLIAFLVASPWNSLSLTIIMVTLIGLQWTLIYIGLSMLIGLISGLIFNGLVARGVLADNPVRQDNSAPVSVIPALKKLVASATITPATVGALLWDGLKDSRMVFRWLFFGLVLATAIRAFVPLETYATLFGPTLAGLMLTLVAATVIEVCSEGSTPIAADLVTRAGAPGNGFTFLMAGIATDYTEIVVLRDLTKSWKIALFLPLVCVPQVLVLGWLLNQFGA
ncbi:MAG: ATPase [Gammaproteobacteria bacterium]|nr:MAG: ATPase [Gammaproteobacteria bacterium]RLA47211.1 MAG: ATPase [Gammaproteobacteria bacterium]